MSTCRFPQQIAYPMYAWYWYVPWLSACWDLFRRFNTSNYVYIHMYYICTHQLYRIPPFNFMHYSQVLLFCASYIHFDASDNTDLAHTIVFMIFCSCKFYSIHVFIPYFMVSCTPRSPLPPPWMQGKFHACFRHFL